MVILGPIWRRKIVLMYSDTNSIDVGPLGGGGGGGGFVKKWLNHDADEVENAARLF
jgi:hypothetical protein